MLGVEDKFLFGTLDFCVDGPCAADRFNSFDEGNSDYSTCLAADPKSLKGHARLFSELYHAMDKSEKETLIFIHGYRHSVTRMQETLRRLERVYIDDARCNIGHLLMVSWPSTADTGEYEEDRKRAIATGCGAFKTFLQELRLFLRGAFKTDAERKQYVDRLNLAVASMGNRLLQATGECFDYDGTRLFNEVIHTSPDVDTHQFKIDRPLKRFSKLARKTHVHFNYGDIVLELSSEIVNDLERRLGHDGPAFGTPSDPDITYINVSLAVAYAALNPDIVLHPRDEAEFPIVHCYFHKVKTVAEDVKRIFLHEERFILRKEDQDNRIDTLRREGLALCKLIPEF